MKGTAVWVNPVTGTMRPTVTNWESGYCTGQAQSESVIATLHPHGWLVGFVSVNIYTDQQVMVPGWVPRDATV